MFSSSFHSFSIVVNFSFFTGQSSDQTGLCGAHEPIKKFVFHPPGTRVGGAPAHLTILQKIAMREGRETESSNMNN